MKNIIALVILSLTLAGCETMAKQTQVVPGMNREAVKIAWGSPQKMQSNKNSCCKLPDEEAWYYFSSKFQAHTPPKYVFFRDNRVETVYVWKR